MAEQISIERDKELRMHKQGTLKSITRWVNTHEEGIAEWLKNTRRAYFPDRANVGPSQWVALLLLKDKTPDADSRIGLLDVGGLTEEDLEKWSIWQDPEASERATTSKRIEETQGNGGKAYMYNLFWGPAVLKGVRNNIKNCKGFIGEPETEERGIPGFIPNRREGENAKVKFWDELADSLDAYNITYHDLPEDVKEALDQQKSFTLVEGIKPKRYEACIPFVDLLEKTIKQPQALSSFEHLDIYAIHNGKILNDGKPLKIEPLPHRIDFDSPRVIEIPESLLDERAVLQSTTSGGSKSRGNLILYTSEKDLSKRLKHRWNVLFKTSHEIVGTLCVGEILPPGVPASQYIYAKVELDALSPDYVNLGRDRPNDGPLLEALNIFISDRICELSAEINEKRIQLLNEEDLDEIHKENRFLDKWKNKYFSDIIDNIEGPSSGGLDEGEGTGGKSKAKKRVVNKSMLRNPPIRIELGYNKDRLIIGRSVKFHLSTILHPVARDSENNPVSNVDFKWWSNNQRIANFSLFSDELEGIRKGSCKIFVGIEGEDIKTQIPVEVWEVDHILLTPRKLEIPLGTRRRILAEITNDDGQRSTDVFLNWKHDALDQLIVRIHPTGWITGNRIGKTVVFAGAGDVMARIGAELEIIPNENLRTKGEGFPSLLLTDKDVDPETGMIRKGDPDKPPLWQEVTDVQHNIWWLNLQNPQVQYAFNFGAGNEFWRMYHAEKTVDMFVQALMQLEYTQKLDDEEPTVWYDHKFIMDDFINQSIQAMWGKLTKYVEMGRKALK